MSFLETILSEKHNEVALLRTRFTEKSFSESKYFSAPTISLMREISSSPTIALIAEVKKASPSKGVIRENFNHLDIAKSYLSSGANALSILTDRKFFEGNISYLMDIAEAKSKPLLRKDFIIDEYQILEARAAGADAILLISEALTKESIASLTKYAVALGLEVLLELHSLEQLNKIDLSLNRLIGVNNRNLRTFETNLETTFLLRKELPADILLVSESGIASRDAVQKVIDAGCDAVLVGEYFMRQENIEAAVAEFLGWIGN